MVVDRLVQRWRALALVGAVGVGFVGVFAVAYVVTVRTAQGRVFGDTALRGALRTRTALSGQTDRVLDIVSAALLLGALAVVATIALARLARLEGLCALALLVGANGSTYVLKRYLLERPDLGLVEVTPSTLNSLPSGHATAVFSAVAATAFVAPSRWRYPVLLVGAVAAILTALATMSAGWHRAADSVTAFAVVGAWTALMGLIVLLGDGTRDDALPAYRWPVSARWVAMGSLAVVLLAIGLAVFLGVLEPVRESDFGSWSAFAVGAMLIAGAALGSATGILAVIRLMRREEAPSALGT